MKRKISINDHAQFLSLLMRESDFDEIDELAADPIHDHRPQSAPKHQVNRVLDILDQLDRENSNRRSIT